MSDERKPIDRLNDAARVMGDTGLGKIVATLSSETDHLRPDEHVKRSLAIVQRLQAGKTP